MIDFDENFRTLKDLKTPAKIQDFLDKFEINFEKEGDTCMSPKIVLRTGKCHCVEGAILAALVLRLQGYKPLIVDLLANSRDFDHVIAVFKKKGNGGQFLKLIMLFLDIGSQFTIPFVN